MDFALKKKSYKEIKPNLGKIISKNKNIYTGSGGSNNIIIINNDVALKIIPNFKKFKLSKIKQNNDQKEIEFYKFFTYEFILPEITPHIVGYYTNYKLYDITELFPKKCITPSQWLLTHPKKINETTKFLCDLKREYNLNMINMVADVVVLENCNLTIEKEIIKILNTKTRSHNKYDLLYEFIDRTIFQFLYTFAQIRKKYPKYIHNDMFLRNVLGIYENKYNDNMYVEYIYDNTSYYLPANGFYIKINDFGYSLNPPYITSTILDMGKANPEFMQFQIDDPKRDIYTFLYDYYDGSGLGHRSINQILEQIYEKKTADKKKKMEKIKINTKKIFKKYIDVKLIDKIHKHNRNNLNNIWNIKNYPILQNSVMLPDMYFKKRVFDKYTILPNNAIIIKKFR